MKIIITIALCFFVAVSQAGENMTEEQRNMMRIMCKECAEQVGATPDDIEAMIDNKEEMTKQGKCLQACMMKKFHLMTEKGELSVQGVKNMTAKITENDEEKVIKAEQYAKKCLSAKDDGDDECVAAYKYSQCMTKEVHAEEA